MAGRCGFYDPVSRRGPSTRGSRRNLRAESDHVASYAAALLCYYSVDFSASQHARIAEAYGLKAWRVEDPRELDTVFRQAIATDGPTLVEVVSQPLHKAAAPVSEWIA